MIFSLHPGFGREGLITGNVLGPLPNIYDRVFLGKEWFFFLQISLQKHSIKEVWQGPKYSSECSQPGITCSKLTIETLEQGVKYFQS